MNYTDEDLRKEASRQYKAATEDPDFTGIAEQMQGREPWKALSEEDFGEAHSSVNELLNVSADVARWAIDMGADGIDPEVNSIDIRTGETPLVRMYFGFRADMPGDVRLQFISAVADALSSLELPPSEEDQ